MVAAVRVHKHWRSRGLDVRGRPKSRRPGQGQVRIKQHACGVNFIDTYFRAGAVSVAGRHAVHRRQ